MSGFADDVAHHAAGSLAAQRCIWSLQNDPGARDVLLDALTGSGGAWRTSEPWLRGFLRELEKRVVSS